MKKINIILNEKDYIEYVIRHGIGRKDKLSEVIKLLCSYYMHECNYSSDQTYDEVIEFFKKNYNRPPNSKIIDMIETYVKRAENRPLIQINNIPIYKSEMDIIESLETQDMQQAALGYVFVVRYNMLKTNTEYTYINCDPIDLINSCNIRGSEDTKLLLFGKLINTGYFAKAKSMNNMNTSVLFMETNTDQEPILKLTEFTDIGKQYRKYKGENYVKCEECGELFLFKGNQKYKICSKCKKKNSLIDKMYTCIECGKTFKRYGDRGKIPIKCPECAKYKKVEAKICVCEDCGKEFESHSRGEKSTRCPECKKKYRREYMRQLMKEKRKSKNVSS